METTTITMQAKPKRRVRNKRPDLRLTATLIEAEDLCAQKDANPTKLALINTRLQIVWSMLKRAENGKLVKAQQRIGELEAECVRLRELLAQPVSSEADRLRRIAASVGGNNAPSI